MCLSREAHRAREAIVINNSSLCFHVESALSGNDDFGPLSARTRDFPSVVRVPFRIPRNS